MMSEGKSWAEVESRLILVDSDRGRGVARMVPVTSGPLRHRSVA